jgi:hypothetical protein
MAFAAFLPVVVFGQQGSQSAKSSQGVGKQAAVPQTRFFITKPTLISFFLDYTDEQVEKEGNEALTDFLFYLPYAEKILREAGVEVHAVVKVKSFDVKAGRRWRTVRPSDKVGYYFIAPGREPEMEFGVEDTESILELARKYFRLPVASYGPNSR